MTIDKKELTKLSPEERIKKLKLMEEERKKEVNEIEELIKKSVHELKTDKIADEIAPEQRAVDISRLFETKGEDRLERTARQEAPSNLMRGNRGYQAMVQTYQAYSQLTKFYGKISMGENLTAEERDTINRIDEQIGVAERYMTEGEKAASKLDASRAVLYKLKKETGL
ncbi:hypothetical protein J4234_06560 [Candidatus Woesearchaeota archaeon]|nr:hypothetical protein [Candidatus Woesearchaeota archaeon]